MENCCIENFPTTIAAFQLINPQLNHCHMVVFSDVLPQVLGTAFPNCMC